MRTVSIVSALLLCAAAASAQAEKPAWKAPAYEPVRAPADFEDPRSQEIEDLISREKIYSVGYHYDHFGVWSEDSGYLWGDWGSFWKQWKVDIIPQAWYARLRGPVTFNDGIVVDVTTAFGLEDQLPEPALRAKVWYKNLYFMLDWYSVRFSGSQRLEEEVTLPDGTIIRVDEELNTDLEIDSFRLALGGTVWKSKKDHWYLDAFLGLNIFHFGLGFTVTDQTGQLDAKAWLPVPVIGASFGGNVGRFIYEIEASGIGLSIQIFGAKFIDLRSSIGWRFSKTIALRAGYRYTDVAAWVSDLKIALELSGPFLELAFSF